MALAQATRLLAVDNCFCCYKFRCHVITDGSAHGIESAIIEGSELTASYPFLPDGYFLICLVVSIIDH
jgi:hypothetical protein